MLIEIHAEDTERLEIAMRALAGAGIAWLHAATSEPDDPSQSVVIAYRRFYRPSTLRHLYPGALDALIVREVDIVGAAWERELRRVVENARSGEVTP